MLNRVCIMGRLVRDPELRRTQSGIAVTTMRIAVERDFKNQDGMKQSDFFDVVAWRTTAEFVSRYFSKGKMMAVDGSLQNREWTDRDGNKRVTTEIVADRIYFGESRRDGEYNGAPSGGYGSGGYGTSGGYGSGGYGAPSGGYGSGGYGTSGGYGSNASGGYGAPSGGYGSGGYGAPSGGYGSGGYGTSGGYASNASGGYGAPSGGYGSGGYGAPSGGYGGYDNPAGTNGGDAENASASAQDAPPDQPPAPDANKKPENANSSFADMSDDDADLPF